MRSEMLIVALEVWREVNSQKWAVAVVVSKGKDGGFRAISGSSSEAASAVLASAMTDLKFDSLQMHGSIQETILEAGARRMAARQLAEMIGGKVGWTAVYGGPLRLVGVVEDASAFHAHDPNPDPDPSPADDINVDADSFRVRRAAQRREREHAAKLAAATEARESAGKTTIRAYHTTDVRLARLSVVGLDVDGELIAEGYIIEDYPGFALIEADNVVALHQQPTFWFYRPTAAISIPVGASPRMEAQEQ